MRMIPSHPTFAKTAKVDWIRAKARSETGSLRLRTKASGRQQPSHVMIIDSLLKFNLFALWRGAGDPLSFLGQSSAGSNGIASNVDCATQLRSVVRLIGAEHGKQSVQQLSHNRYDGLQSRFAAS